jgi:hypothetical protein
MSLKASAGRASLASKRVVRLAKLDESEPGTHAVSSTDMKQLYREVEELEKQEKRAMASRAASLAKVLAATTKCPAGDEGCGQAHLDINWKLAKDKYEQVIQKISRSRLCSVRNRQMCEMTSRLEFNSLLTQAAFNDVVNDEKQRNETTMEGEAEFDKISKV